MVVQNFGPLRALLWPRQLRPDERRKEAPGAKASAIATADKAATTLAAAAKVVAAFIPHELLSRKIGVFAGNI